MVEDAVVIIADLAKGMIIADCDDLLVTIVDSLVLEDSFVSQQPFEHY